MTAIAAILAVDVLVLLILFAWAYTRTLVRDAEADTAWLTAEERWLRAYVEQQKHWQEVLKEERDRNDQTLRHLLNRIQDPNFAITEVPASELEKTGVDYDEGSEEAVPPSAPEPGVIPPDLDELSDEELALEEEEEPPARHINFAELSVDPAQPQQPHQPLKVGSEDDGVSGS